jgi:uncharacterized protein YidB (DUF937 family)
MGLFEQILGAIDNPNQQASSNQLGNILNVVQQVGGSQGLDASSTQAMLSVVGGYVRSALQEQRTTGGEQRVEAIVNQFGSTNASPEALTTLFSPAQQQQLANAVAQRTGIDANTVQSVLPVIVPVVLNLLKTGSSAPAAQGGSTGTNSVLNTFLDADGDGDVDLGDTLSMASRYLGQR